MNRPLALDTRAAARLLSVSNRTLEGLRVRGGGPPYTRVGGRVLYRVEALEKYLREQERTSTSAAVSYRSRQPGGPQTRARSVFQPATRGAVNISDTRGRR